MDAELTKIRNNHFEISEHGIIESLSNIRDSISLLHCDVDINSTLIIHNGDIENTIKQADNYNNSRIYPILTSINPELVSTSKDCLILFRQPIYLTAIKLFFKDTDQKPHWLKSFFKVSSINSSGQKEDIDLKSERLVNTSKDSRGALYSIEVNRLSTGLILSKPGHLVHASAIKIDDQLELNLNRIQTESFKFNTNFVKFDSTISDALNKAVADLSAKENQKKLLATEIEAKKSEVNRFDDEITKKVQRLRDTNQQIDILKRDLSDTENLIFNENEKLVKTNIELSSLKSMVKEQQLSIKSGEEKLANATSEYEDLHNEITKLRFEQDTYTLDLKGHLTETNKQLRYYYIACCILITLLGSIFIYISTNAAKSVELFNNDYKIDMLSLFLSRLPLISSTTLIIGATSALLYFLVNHIISINRDRMCMLKAAILAEQISVSLASELDLTKDERKEESKKIKVDLIMKLFNQSVHQEVPTASSILQTKEILELLQKDNAK